MILYSRKPQILFCYWKKFNLIIPFPVSLLNPILLFSIELLFNIETAHRCFSIPCSHPAINQTHFGKRVLQDFVIGEVEEVHRLPQTSPDKL